MHKLRADKNDEDHRRRRRVPGGSPPTPTTGQRSPGAAPTTDETAAGPRPRDLTRPTECGYGPATMAPAAPAGDSDGLRRTTEKQATHQRDNERCTGPAAKYTDTHAATWQQAHDEAGRRGGPYARRPPAKVRRRRHVTVEGHANDPPTHHDRDPRERRRGPRRREGGGRDPSANRRRGGQDYVPAQLRGDEDRTHQRHWSPPMATSWMSSSSLQPQ